MSRYSISDIPQILTHEAAVGRISRSSVWRILAADALKPWRYRMWLFPRAPDFAAKAGRVLDLYAGWWEGSPLGAGDYLLSADEKTSIQARCRCPISRPPCPGQPAHVEHEYDRQGAVQYLAAWDVRRGLVFGRCETHTGIAPFGRLVDDVMSREPYRSANRVFWIVDNGSSHRGQAAVDRLQSRYPNLILVHLPVHASWLNPIEIYFSIVQRKVLTPNDFPDCAAVAQRLRAFEYRLNSQPKPFAWRFTRADLDRWLDQRAADLGPLRPAA